jgi:hypothetical protein
LSAKKQAELENLLADVAVPPIKPAVHESGIDFNILPAFDEKKLEPYLKDAGTETELQKTVHKTQILLFAVSGLPPPAELAEPVQELAMTLKGNLSILREGYRAPANENDLKNQIMRDERRVAALMARLNEALEDMKSAGEKRNDEGKRWQANYDYMLARLEDEIAYLWEYQSMLGQMRKEVPPLDRKLYRGWKLAATTTLSGDSTGKKLAAAARKTLDKIIKDHAGTPWEVLAKRQKLTALGLEWKPAN